MELQIEFAMKKMLARGETKSNIYSFSHNVRMAVLG